MSEFTEQEQKWYDNLRNTEQKIKEYSESNSISKSDLNFMKSYVKFLSLALKYENLRFADDYAVCKRLIRVYHSIPTAELDCYLTEYVLLDGLYIVTDVLFINKRVYNEYVECPLENVRVSLKLPDNLMCGTLKETYINGKTCAVGLINTPLTHKYIQNSSNWDYLVWEK